MKDIASLFLFLVIRLQDSLVINISGSNGSISLIFVHGDIHQEKVVCEDTTFGWVSPGISSHVKTCLDLRGDPLGSLGGITSWKIFQNERLIKF